MRHSATVHESAHASWASLSLQRTREAAGTTCTNSQIMALGCRLRGSWLSSGIVTKNALFPVLQGTCVDVPVGCVARSRGSISPAFGSSSPLDETLSHQRSAPLENEQRQPHSTHTLLVQFRWVGCPGRERQPRQS